MHPATPPNIRDVLDWMYRSDSRPHACLTRAWEWSKEAELDLYAKTDRDASQRQHWRRLCDQLDGARIAISYTL